MADLLVVLTVASAHIMTNLDNLAILLAMLGAGGRAGAVSAFALVQGLAMLLAAVLGEALGQVLGGVAGGAAGTHLRLLGLLPIAFGLYQIARRGPVGPADAAVPAFTAQLAVFAACSADSLAVLAALYADSTDRFDVWISAGAAASILLVAGLALILGARVAPLARRLEPLAPFVMIAAGIYVLMDTPTDFG